MAKTQKPKKSLEEKLKDIKAKLKRLEEQKEKEDNAMLFNFAKNLKNLLGRDLTSDDYENFYNTIANSLNTEL